MSSSPETVTMADSSKNTMQILSYDIDMDSDNLMLVFIMDHFDQGVSTKYNNNNQTITQKILGTAYTYNAKIIDVPTVSYIKIGTETNSPVWINTVVHLFSQSSTAFIVGNAVMIDRKNDKIQVQYI